MAEGTDNQSVDVGSTVTGSARFKRAVAILASIGAIVIGASLIIAVIGLSVTGDVIYAAIVVEHYPVAIGLPMAAIAALVLVYLLEYARGPIEFKVSILEFKGAAGPLVLWVFIYLAIGSSIALLWDDTMSSNVTEKMFEEKLKTAILKERFERCEFLMEKEFQNLKREQIEKQCAEKLAKKQ